jgi:hypothetical protein
VLQSTVQPRRPGRRQPTINLANSSGRSLSPEPVPGSPESSGPTPGQLTQGPGRARAAIYSPAPATGQRQLTIKLKRPLTQSRASPGQLRILRASTRATHLGTGPGTCCNLQSILGGPDSGKRNSSSSDRSLSPETVPGDPKPSGPPPGQRAGAGGPAGRDSDIPAPAGVARGSGSWRKSWVGPNRKRP